MEGIASPHTKSVDLTEREIHLLYIACRFMGRSKSTTDQERATLDAIMTKIVKLNANEN